MIFVTFANSFVEITIIQQNICSFNKMFVELRKCVWSYITNIIIVLSTKQFFMRHFSVDSEKHEETLKKKSCDHYYYFFY